MRSPAFPKLLLLACALVLSPAPGLAHDSEAGPVAPGVDGEPAAAGAPVVIDGEALFTVYGIPSYPAAERAEAIAARIRGIARDPAFDPGSLTIVHTDADTRIAAGGQFILRILERDAEIEGTNRQTLAEIFLFRIRQAVAAYRASRTQAALVAASWRAALAVLSAVLALAVLGRVFRALDGWLERRYGPRVRSVTISSFEVVRGERIRAVAHAMVRLAKVVSYVLLVFFSVEYALARFPWTRGAASRLGDWALAPLSILGDGLVRTLPDLVFLAVLALATRYALRLVRLFFEAVGRGRVVLKGFEPEWAEPTYKLVRLAVIAFALIVAYPYIPGSNSAAFKGISIFAGVLFSLSSSTALANVIAGYMMIYRRAYHEGDVVKLGDVVGVVTRFRLQATHLRTWKNEEVVVPNSATLGTQVVNYSTLARTDGLVLHTTVGIGYETPWRQVEAMLLEAAARTPGLKAEPKPFVLQTALGDFAVTYEINAHCGEPASMLQTYSALHANILDVFNEYGVQIMTPAYMADTPEPKVVPRDKWHLPPAPKP
jgi:small-conductance mechanosensitive channel